MELIPERIQEIFSQAQQKKTPAEREKYLAEACQGDLALRQRIESMLRAKEQADEFFGQTVQAPTANFVTERAGTMIGRYKLLEQIGEGGFGVVYVAEQEVPVRRRVALKVIKLGMDTKQVIARFEAERQALALMDHPNIAKVLDAGATDSGRPFFVMELVKGERITDYCDKDNLSTRERLDLFVQICHAIQHAHQKGIIHRDIKPSNILVTMHDGVPVPKVIDFGIAKATEHRLTDKTVYTALEQMIGTPAYMSPEQAEMSGIDIDTRSDIYSLGVLLYELLTGKTPFDPKELVEAGLETMRRTIREKEPQRPSTRLTTMVEGELTATAKRRQTDPPKLVHLVRGDLDWIVMKCLEKNRTRRYETANGLASDLERYLNHEAVVARPPSQLYRFQKLVQRNKLVFAAASAIAAALAVGVAMSVWGLVKEHQSRLAAEANEQKAEAEAAKSRQVAQFLKDMLKGVGPSVALGRDTALLREILDNTAKRVGTDLAKQPEVEAELRYTLGEVYWELGDLEDAEAMHRAALAIRIKEFGTNNPQVAESMRRLGHVLWRRGRLEEAEKTARNGIAMQRTLFGSTNLEVAASLDDLAAILNTKNETTEVKTMLREALAIREALLGHDTLEVADTLEELDGASHEALEIKKKLLGADNPLVIITSLRIQAIELESQGKLGEAENAQNEILAAQRKIYGNEHPSLAQTLNRLASLLKKEGKLAESESIRREALAMQRKCLGNENDEVAQTLANLGSVLRDENKLSEAESMYRESLLTLRKVFGNDSAKVGRSFANLCGVLEKEGKHKEVKALYSEAANDASSLTGLGESLYKAGKLEEAKTLYLLAADGTNAAAAAAQNHLGDMYQLGKEKSMPKDLVEAANWYRKAAELGNASGQDSLGYMYEAGQGVEQDYTEAVKWYRKAAEQGDSSAQNNLGWMYIRGLGVEKNVADAFQWYRKSAERGSRAGQKSLGWMYENGLGAEKDYAEAVKWYRRSAEQGSSEGQMNLGRMYENGLGVEKDYVEAVKWYRKAADKGRSDAIIHLVGMYEHGTGGLTNLAEVAKWCSHLGAKYQKGDGVPQDQAAAAKWYRKAAEEGDAAGQVYVAGMYKQGKGVAQDYAEAVKWYRKAAEQGDAAGQLYLAGMYVQGKGVEKDYGESVKWCRKVAERGNADGQVFLGYMYETGKGVAKDYAEAINLYRNAAEQGSSDGQMNLGWMYARGKGVAKDLTEAVRWYRKAAESGNATAQYRLARMYQSGEGVPKNDSESAKYFAAIEKGGAQELNELAWELATSGAAKDRDGTNAVHFAEKAVAATNRKDPNILDTLAAAYAEADQFEKAVATEKQAIALLKDGKMKKDCGSRLSLYQSNTPYREP